MREERSWFTPKQAADLTGVTTRTINNYITSGKLSATREDNRYYIDKSEFFRVFPNCMAEKNLGNPEKQKEKHDSKALEIEIQYLKEALLDKERQNDFLIQQLDNFTDEKSKMLEAINSHTRLLEFKATDKKSTKWFWPFKKR